MLLDRLKNHHLVLASGSPRRQQYFKELGLDVEIRLKPIEEIYPSGLSGAEISDYLAKLKATPFEGSLLQKEILITSDTVVWHNGESLAKALDKQEAYEMLKKLSGNWHDVITSVCFTTLKNQIVQHQVTRVKFRELTNEEINFYIDAYQPFDKAGAYGIQEWIGLIAIEEIQGSYTNVVGLPTQLVYKTLMGMVG
ncbi:Maf family nucleotide pyrophosphatase [Costertonia aggregata]|uniref:dTTP/UTP pyrophosphatase n=1 Tax=Costertonia aggregata TaxID=343403 RepID=A0A7H9ATL0_9FLAO|nr:Maf family nucleotide pyrophosphatase [Costertonia aggregata]QLG46756.1 septum formation protein Maf [Costertonia aggregata]